jgi:hypothetical protein
MADTAGENADPHPAPTPLPELMARLAAGDGVALFELLEAHRGQVRATVARLLRRLEARVDAEQLDELVAEAVLVVQEVAGSWRPDGGALPWVWAERRISARVAAYLGQYTVELDGERDLVDADRGAAATTATAHGEAGEWETLASLARRDERVALLHAALAEVTTMRQRTILLAYEALKSDGDPSPSHTVATEFGLSPANVRRTIWRTKVRVDNLVRTDERYASIRDLPILR